MITPFVKSAPINPYLWLDTLAPEKRWVRGRVYRVAKRCMDLLLVGVTLPFVLPVLALCALLIKLDDPNGPVLFVQERTGRGGRRFRMYKFRTMVVNAEQLLKQLAATNADGELAKPLKLDNDPRVTRIGRLLRKTSLDELPQIINILKGEMSWVGPRPTSFGLKSYSLWHTERLDLLPGLTGLWQLYGRGDVDFNNWLRWDIRYLEKQCLWLDVQILLRTAGAIFTQRGAR